MMGVRDKIQRMGFGFPDVSALTAKLDEAKNDITDRLDAILVELRTLNSRFPPNPPQP